MGRRIAKCGWVVAAAVFLGVAVVSVDAAAQQEGAGANAEKRSNAEVAQRLFEEGYEAYSEESYSKALSLWRKAYEYVPKATFLYNAANAASKLGNSEQALGLARRAGKQENQPLSENLEKKNEQLVAELEERIEQEEKEREMQEARGLDWRGWSGIGGIAAGGTMTALGLGVFGRKASELNAGLGEVSTRSDYEQRRSRMEKNQTVGRILLFSGVGFAAAGAGLLAWDLVEMPQDREMTFRFGIRGRPGASVNIQF